MANLCHHSKGFTVKKQPETDDFDWLYECNNHCGFKLNFNPENYLTGIAYLSKTEGLDKPGKVIRLTPDTKGAKQS